MKSYFSTEQVSETQSIEQVLETPPIKLPAVIASGLLLYESESATPVEYQPDIDLSEYMFLRPFATISSAHPGKYYVRFVLTTGSGRWLYNSTQYYKLSPGHNQVYAHHRLNLDDVNVSLVNWKFFIYIEDTLLHSEVVQNNLIQDYFRLEHENPGEVSQELETLLENGEFRQYLDGDGELTDEFMRLLEGDAEA